MTAYNRKALMMAVVNLSVVVLVVVVGAGILELAFNPPSGNPVGAYLATYQNEQDHQVVADGFLLSEDPTPPKSRQFNSNWRYDRCGKPYDETYYLVEDAPIEKCLFDEDRDCNERYRKK